MAILLLCIRKISAKQTLIYKVPCRNHPNTEPIDENVKNILTYDRHQAVSLSNASVQSQASGSLEIQKSQKIKSTNYDLIKTEIIET